MMCAQRFGISKCSHLRMLFRGFLPPFPATTSTKMMFNIQRLRLNDPALAVSPTRGVTTGTSVKKRIQSKKMQDHQVNSVGAALNEIVHLHCTKGELTKALEVIHAMHRKQQNEEVLEKKVRSGMTYHSVLRLAIEKEEVDQAWQIVSMMKEMHGQHLAPYAGILASLSALCVRKGLMKKVLEIGELKMKYKMDMSAKEYNSLLHFYAQRRNVDGVFATAETMTSRGLAPDIGAFRSLILLCGNIQTALDILARMKRANIAPDEAVCAAMIDAFTGADSVLNCDSTTNGPGSLEAALKFLEVMKREHNIRPNVDIFASLIGGCARQNDFIKAKALLKMMREIKLKPNAAIYNVLLETYAEVAEKGNRKAKLLIGDAKQAVNEILRSMKQDGVVLSSKTLNTLIQIYAASGHLAAKQADQVLDIIQDSHNKLIPSEASCCIFIDHYCLGGSTLQVHQVLGLLDTARHRSQQQQQQKTTLHRFSCLYSRLLEAALTKLDVEGAVEVYSKMMRLCDGDSRGIRLIPTYSAYSTLLRLCLAKGDTARGKVILREMMDCIYYTHDHHRQQLFAEAEGTTTNSSSSNIPIDTEQEEQKGHFVQQAQEELCRHPDLWRPLLRDVATLLRRPLSAPTMPANNNNNNN